MTDEPHPARQPFMSGSVPVPDPTLLTTQQLIREIKALQDIIDAKLAGMDRASANMEILINEKIECISHESFERHKAVQMQFSERDVRFDQALTGAMEVARAARDSLENKTAHVLELHNERFVSVAKQFEQRDVALVATLTSTKEAIAKSEAATVKAIDQIQILLHTATGGLESKISDIKDRITAIESAKAGQVAQRGEAQGSQIQWVGIMGLVLGAVVGLGGILMALTSGNTVAPIPERVVIEQAPPAGGSGNLR